MNVSSMSVGRFKSSVVCAVLALIFVMGVSPMMARAQNIPTNQTDISSLLAIIAQLQAQLAALMGPTPAKSTVPKPVEDRPIPHIYIDDFTDKTISIVANKKAKTSLGLVEFQIDVAQDFYVTRVDIDIDSIDPILRNKVRAVSIEQNGKSVCQSNITSPISGDRLTVPLDCKFVKGSSKISVTITLDAFADAASDTYELSVGTMNVHFSDTTKLFRTVQAYSADKTFQVLVDAPMVRLIDVKSETLNNNIVQTRYRFEVTPTDEDIYLSQKQNVSFPVMVTFGPPEKVTYSTLVVQGVSVNSYGMYRIVRGKTHLVDFTTVILPDSKSGDFKTELKTMNYSFDPTGTLSVTSNLPSDKRLIVSVKASSSDAVTPSTNARIGAIETKNQPITIRGTASTTIKNLGVVVASQLGDKEYGSGNLVVNRDGRWSHRLNDLLPIGSYIAILYVDNKEVQRTNFTIATTTTNIQVGKNPVNCDRKVSKLLANNEFACYGMWDYGDAFGGDKHMCGAFGRGTTTGCVIAAPMCQSGQATARFYFSNSTFASNTNNLTTISNRLKTTPDMVRQGVAGIWAYRCSESTTISSGPIPPPATTTVPMVKAEVLGASTDIYTEISGTLTRISEILDTIK